MRVLERLSRQRIGGVRQTGIVPTVFVLLSGFLALVKDIPALNVIAVVGVSVIVGLTLGVTLVEDTLDSLRFRRDLLTRVLQFLHTSKPSSSIHGAKDVDA